jgi:TPR repeat protein
MLADAGRTLLPTSRAAELLQRAAKLGHLTALGFCRLRGIGGVAQDYGKAYQFFEAAASKGMASGVWMMGVCQLEGWGMPKNPEIAYRMFTSAAQKKSNVAQCEIGSSFLSVLLLSIASCNDPLRCCVQVRCTIWGMACARTTERLSSASAPPQSRAVLWARPNSVCALSWDV